jgi:hypothetical protein
VKMAGYRCLRTKLKEIPMFRFLKKLGFMKKRKSGLEIKVIRNNESFDVDIVDATDAELFECCEFVVLLSRQETEN